MGGQDDILWKDAGGNPLSCREKLKMLDGNLREMTEICQDALDDALLMGCSQPAFKQALHAMIDQLEPTVKERS